MSSTRSTTERRTGAVEEKGGDPWLGWSVGGCMFVCNTNQRTEKKVCTMVLLLLFSSSSILRQRR